jgi:hypothetical protein
MLGSPSGKILFLLYEILSDSLIGERNIFGFVFSKLFVYFEGI